MDHGKEVFLTTVIDDMKVEIIEEELKNEGIPVIKKHRGGGAYFNILMGRSMYGVDLYVSEESYDRAREILRDLGIINMKDGSTAEEEQKRNAAREKQKRAQARMLKTGIALVFLLWLILWWRSG